MAEHQKHGGQPHGRAKLAVIRHRRKGRADQCERQREHRIAHRDAAEQRQQQGGRNQQQRDADGLQRLIELDFISRQDAQMEEYTRGFEDDVSDAVNIVISGIRMGTEEHAKVQASYSKTAEKLFESADKKYEEGDVSGSILDRMAGSAIVQTGGESGALTRGMH